MKRIEISREELYKRVWEKPLSKLSQAFGMSDVGLRKLCMRNGIPVPPAGYHLMTPGTKKDRLKIDLPPCEKHQRSWFTFKVDYIDSPDGESDRDRSDFNDLFLHKPTPNENQISIIKRNLKEICQPLKKRVVDDRGVMKSEIGYPIRVAPDSLDRALEFFTTLLGVLSTLGADILAPTDDTNNNLVVNWLGYDIRFYLEERSRRIKPPPYTPKRKTHIHRGESWVFRPTGLFQIETGGLAHISMRDGKKKLEERLQEFLEKLYLIGRQKQREDAIRERRIQNAVVRLQELDEIRQKEEFAEAKIKSFIKESIRWRKSEQLRRYIDAIEERGYSASDKVHSDESSWVSWLNWAKKYIDSIDPITLGVAGEVPPYPEPKKITGIPRIYLDYDDPLEAEEEMKNRGWY